MNEFLFNPKSPNDIAKEFVEKIKQQRKMLKISQVQLAAKSAVSLGSIKRFESKYEISLTALIKILIALNVISSKFPIGVAIIYKFPFF